MIRSAEQRYWVGVDPGGAKRFGLAFLTESGDFTNYLLSFADEALQLITYCPLAVGVDAPLWWSSGKSSDRKADQIIRTTHKIAAGTVQTSNSLRGAALVQAVMFISRLRERFPSVPVTEVHPKAVAIALGGWDCEAVKSLGSVSGVGEHEHDARMAAIAAREGYQGRWKRDLSLDRHPSEQDPKTYWLGPVNYFWPLNT